MKEKHMEMTPLSVGMVAAAAALSGVSTGAAAQQMICVKGVVEVQGAVASRQAGILSADVLEMLAAAKPSPFYILGDGPVKPTDPCMAQA